MVGVVNAWEVTEAVKDMLVATVSPSRPVGNGSSPVDLGEPLDPDLPFSIVFRTVLGGGGLGVGSFGFPDDMMRFGIQISAVGVDLQMASALADRNRVALLDRGGSAPGGFVNDIDLTTSGTIVMERALEGFGVTEEEGQFVTVSDRYELTLIIA